MNANKQSQQIASAIPAINSYFCSSGPHNSKHNLHGSGNIVSNAVNPNPNSARLASNAVAVTTWSGIQESIHQLIHSVETQLGKIADVIGASSSARVYNNNNNNNYQHTHTHHEQHHHKHGGGGIRAGMEMRCVCVYVCDLLGPLYICLYSVHVFGCTYI